MPRARAMRPCPPLAIYTNRARHRGAGRGSWALALIAGLVFLLPVLMQSGSAESVRPGHARPAPAAIETPVVAAPAGSLPIGTRESSEAPARTAPGAPIADPAWTPVPAAIASDAPVATVAPVATDLPVPEARHEPPARPARHALRAERVDPPATRSHRARAHRERPRAVPLEHAALLARQVDETPASHAYMPR